GADGKIIIWNVNAKEVKKEFPNHGEVIININLISDDSLITVSESGAWKVWDIKSGKLLSTSQDSNVKCRSLIVSSDKEKLISTNLDGSISLWDSQTGEYLRQIKSHEARALISLLSSTKETVISGGADGIIREWKIDSGELLLNFAHHSDRIETLTKSQDGKYLVSGSADTNVCIWDIIDGDLLEKYSESSDVITSVACTKDFVISGNRDGRIHVWDFSTGELRWVSPKTDVIWAIAASPIGNSFASGGEDSIIRVWGLEEGIGSQESPISVEIEIKEEKVESITTKHEETTFLKKQTHAPPDYIFQGHKGYINSLTFSPDSRLLISSSKDGTIRFWDMDEKKMLKVLLVDEEGCSGGTSTHNGELVVVGTPSGIIKVWDVEKSTFLKKITSQTSPISSLKITSDDLFIITSNFNGTINKWNLSTCEHLDQIKVFQDASAIDIDVSKDGKEIVVCGGDVIQLWNLSSKSVDRNFTGHENLVICVAFSTDNKLIISGSLDNTIRIWEKSTGNLIRTITSINHSVSDLTLSPDGILIAAACGHAKKIEIWDIQSGEKLSSLGGHSDFVHSVAISPDNNYIASGGRDNIIFVWSLEKLDLLEKTKTEGLMKRKASQNIRFQQKFKETLDPIKQEMMNTPGNLDPWIKYAITLTNLGDLPEAAEVYKAILEALPRNPELWKNLGITLMELDRKEEAVDAFLNVLNYDPSNVPVLQNVCVTLAQLGQFKRVLPLYNRLVEFESDRGMNWAGLGLVHRSLGNLEEAKKCFQRAADLDPNISY
ncbi:MAG: WD40 repeat domain-containing protein, partial [Promethearchaeota archaeon]